jgi:hypothetical protein
MERTKVLYDLGETSMASLGPLCKKAKSLGVVEHKGHYQKFIEHYYENRNSEER